MIIAGYYNPWDLTEDFFYLHLLLRFESLVNHRFNQTFEALKRKKRVVICFSLSMNFGIDQIPVELRHESTIVRSFTGCVSIRADVLFRHLFCSFILLISCTKIVQT